jgi:NTE family protein
MAEDASYGSKDVALVLGGGNALGAYHLGGWERLEAAGLRPDWLVGTSIGAVTAAILVGNPPERRTERLRAFWRIASQTAAPFAAALPGFLRARLNNDHAFAALLFGRPGLFGSRFPGPWSLMPGMPPDRALRDHAPLARTLEELIDFDRIAGAEERLSFPTIDLETGEEVWFDNRETRIESRHLLAATALAPLFPAVEIDGRLLCDAGFGNNLPLDRPVRAEPERDLLLIAMDAYHLGHGRPKSIDETAARVQDIAFAMQSRRAIDAFERERALLRRCEPGSPAAVLGYLAYRPPGHQRTLKPFDFSEATLRERTERGRAAMDAMLARLPEVDWDAPCTVLKEPQ